jgi:hypothetical protein
MSMWTTILNYSGSYKSHPLQIPYHIFCQFFVMAKLACQCSLLKKCIMFLSQRMVPKYSNEVCLFTSRKQQRPPVLSLLTEQILKRTCFEHPFVIGNTFYTVFSIILNKS